MQGFGALSPFFFADDVLLFSHGSKTSIKHTMNCLSTFSSMSGLNPSVHKSTVFFCNCKQDLTSWFDSVYHIPHGMLPVKFFGVPLISSKLSINDCMHLLDRITGRLYSWTSILLSLAGRLQLIKAVLFSIQAYWSKHFMLPSAVHKQLQTYFTRFLWKGDPSVKGGAKVS